MKSSYLSVAGESRTCPHCKATILKTAVTCPICQHVLRFASAGVNPRANPTQCPLLVEGTINHPGDGGPLEYSVLLEVHDQTGKLVSRQIVGVGAFRQAEKRSFSVRVEVSSPTKDYVPIADRPSNGLGTSA